MKQIATVIPGLLNKLAEDERLAGFRWHENRLGAESVVDVHGNPYPIRAVTCLTDNIAGRMLMFTLTVLNSPLGFHGTDKDHHPSLVGIISLEEYTDVVVRIEQLIDALQNCYIYDTDKDRDDDATNMMSCFANMKLANGSSPMLDLSNKLGLRLSDPFHIGYVGELEPMSHSLMNAIRWRTLGGDKIPKMDGPQTHGQAFAVYSTEVHMACLEMGFSHTLDWDNRTKDWTLMITTGASEPQGVFQYGDLGQVFQEALAFIYSEVEKKYAK